MGIRSIPLKVLRERGPLTINQAVLYYLCEDEDGPHMEPNEAAYETGFPSRVYVWQTLQRAKGRLEGDGT